MTKQTESPPLPLHESDETAWLELTAGLIAQGRFDEIDQAALAEYLTDMAKRDRREVASRLTLLLAHLLKWQHQPEHRSNSWRATILSQQHELEDWLDSAYDPVAGLRFYLPCSLIRYARAWPSFALDAMFADRTDALQ